MPQNNWKDDLDIKNFRKKASLLSGCGILLAFVLLVICIKTGFYAGIGAVTMLWLVSSLVFLINMTAQ